MPKLSILHIYVHLYIFHLFFYDHEVTRHNSNAQIGCSGVVYSKFEGWPRSGGLAELYVFDVFLASETSQRRAICETQPPHF